MNFGAHLDDLKFAWRLCRKARNRGAYRPYGSWSITVDTDTGYLWRYQGKCYIVADGSDNFLEWVKNLFWIRWGRDKVALGFLKTAVEFADISEKLLYPDDVVVLVGHSRAGFVQKTAIELKRRGVCVESVITFGSPKMGGKQFCRSMEEEKIYHVRVYSPDDPVPSLPKLRGKHYESVSVTFPKRKDLFSMYRASRFVRGVIDHLSYGTLLNGESQWKF